MPQAKIEVIENRQMRTEVYVDGKLAYQSGNAVPVEKKNIKRLLRLLDGIDDEIIDEEDKELSDLDKRSDTH